MTASRVAVTEPVDAMELVAVPATDSPRVAVTVPDADAVVAQVAATDVEHVGEPDVESVKIARKAAARRPASMFPAIRVQRRDRSRF